MTSDPIAPERAADAARSASTRKPAVHTWQGADPPRLESVRVLIGDARLRAYGRLIAAADPQIGSEPYSASFEASVDKVDSAGRVLLRTTTAEHERQISLSRSEDGIWLVDHGSTSQRADFDGSVTVDVAGSVTFTTLPVRHLGLHHTSGEFEIPVVSVSLPDLTVTVVHVVYRTVSIDENGTTVAFTRGGATSEIHLDRDGIVVDYPGVATRL